MQCELSSHDVLPVLATLYTSVESTADAPQGERVPLDDRVGSERQPEPDVWSYSCFRSVPSHRCSLLFWVSL